MKISIEFEATSQLKHDEQFNAIALHALSQLMNDKALEKWNTPEDFAEHTKIEGNDYTLNIHFQK